MQGGVSKRHDIFCVSFAMHASLTNLEILATRVNQARFSLAPTHLSILSAGDSSYVFSKSEGLPARACRYELSFSRPPRLNGCVKSILAKLHCLSPL